MCIVCSWSMVAVLPFMSYRNLQLSSVLDSVSFCQSKTWFSGGVFILKTVSISTWQRSHNASVQLQNWEVLKWRSLRSSSPSLVIFSRACGGHCQQGGSQQWPILQGDPTEERHALELWLRNNTCWQQHPALTVLVPCSLQFSLLWAQLMEILDGLLDRYIHHFHSMMSIIKLLLAWSSLDYHHHDFLSITKGWKLNLCTS